MSRTNQYFIDKEQERLEFAEKERGYKKYMPLTALKERIRGNVQRFQDHNINPNPLDR